MTITLSSGAHAQSVMDRLAALLNMSQPVKFETYMHTPPQTPDKALGAFC